MQTLRKRCDEHIMNSTNRITFALALGLLALAGSGCGSDQIASTQAMVKQQQEQIEQQQQEIDALKTNQAYTPGVASAPGGCDSGVENAATERGGEQFSSGNFNKALAYYNDALTACPSSDQAQVNVARTYEALGNKPAAIKHYRIAAESTSPTVSRASDQAKDALVRLQASMMP
jgi:tetratricopeptide (TPR) repeat protein